MSVVTCLSDAYLFLIIEPYTDQIEGSLNFTKQVLSIGGLFSYWFTRLLVKHSCTEAWVLLQRLCAPAG